MTDPLAGKRAAINAGELDSLQWPDEGKGCPVERGQVFNLAKCHIEIVGTRRVREAGRFLWRAGFERIWKSNDKPLFLDRKSGTTHDVDAAMSAQDDPEAPTIASVDPLDNPLNTGPPPEAEAIPDHEVKHLPTTIAARKRYEEVHGENVDRRLRRSLVEEVREAKLSPAEVDRVREVLAEIRGDRKLAA